MRIIVDPQSVFLRMASLVTVGDIMSPLGPPFSVTTYLSWAEQEVRSQHPDVYGQDVSIIFDGDDPVSYIDWYQLFCDVIDMDGEDEPIVRDVASPIPIGNIVGASVSYFDVVERLATSNRCYLFVHDGRKIAGTVFYRDLFRPAGVACLFALMLELENTATTLCENFFSQCVGALPSSRLEAALKLFRLRGKDRARLEADYDLDRIARLRGRERDFLDCTCFIDKATMINKCKLLVDFSASEIKSLFKRAERVRNACAHPTDENSIAAILPRKHLRPFLNNCSRLMESMRNVTPRQ